MVLQANQLSKQYGAVLALDRLDLNLVQGEIFCLLGQNGAGKTTTLNIFLGFVKPTSGTAMVCGRDVRSSPEEARKKLAYVPEVVMLYPLLSGKENLEYFSRLAGFRYTSGELKRFLMDAGLQEEAIDVRLKSYSKGMRQKVGIAIAVAKNADVILMDEPTSGLDPRAVVEFTAICRKLAAQGRTILMATHDLFHAAQVANRFGIMKRGRMIHDLDASQVDAVRLQEIYLETI